MFSVSASTKKARTASYESTYQTDRALPNLFKSIIIFTAPNDPAPNEHGCCALHPLENRSQGGADFALHARPEKTAAGVAACPPPLSTPSQYAAMTASRPLAVLRRWSARTSRDSQACRDRSGQQNPSRASRSRARPRAVLPANLQGDCGASACAITRSSPHPCTRLIGLVLRFCSQTSRPSFAFTLIQGHEPVSWQPVRRCRREEAARHSLSRH